MNSIPVPDASAKVAWYSGLNSKHWRILTASFLGWVFDGYESYALFIVMPFVLNSMLTLDMLGNRALWGGVAISVTLLGWGLGGLVGGVLADYVGRKRMMILSVFFYAIFTGLTAFATNFWVFCFLRFITGIAMGSEWSTGVALLAETWPNRARPKGAGFLQSGFGFGTLIAALVWLVLSQTQPLGQDTWRLVFVVGTLPAFFCLYIRRAVGESEKWLEAVRKQRWAATEKTSGATAASGKRPFTLSEIFREPESRRRTLLAFLLSLTTTVGWWAISSWLPEYAAQMAKASGIANPGQWALRAALLYTGGAVVAYLLSGFLADALGRRVYLFLTYLGALITTALTYLWTSTPDGLLLAAFVNGFFTLGCAYSWMAIYPVELFTSSVRATAAAFIFNAARMIAWVFPILAGTMIHTFGSIPRAAMTLSTIYVIGLIVPWFMPETRGKELPE
ncbi:MULTISPECIES: MFS transporter [unclassified Variovorax]|uniref:MFS transporter n=1 Tax=unclassified Variovorax TaxID=663243 RepID=UPI003F4894E8